MAERVAARSKIIEYEIASCVHCGDDVFIDTEAPNTDDLPKGINVIIGGGEHTMVEKSSLFKRVQDYHAPRVLVKWFLPDRAKRKPRKQYICPACAKEVYGYEHSMR